MSKKLFDVVFSTGVFAIFIMLVSSLIGASVEDVDGILVGFFSMKFDCLKLSEFKSTFLMIVISFRSDCASFFLLCCILVLRLGEVGRFSPKTVEVRIDGFSLVTESGTGVVLVKFLGGKVLLAVDLVVDAVVVSDCC